MTKDETIQDLTYKVQFLLDHYIPLYTSGQNADQFMFPDGDVWIIKPKGLVR